MLQWFITILVAAGLWIGTTAGVYDPPGKPDPPITVQGGPGHACPPNC